MDLQHIGNQQEPSGRVACAFALVMSASEWATFQAEMLQAFDPTGAPIKEKFVRGLIEALRAIEMPEKRLDVGIEHVSRREFEALKRRMNGGES